MLETTTRMYGKLTTSMVNGDYQGYKIFADKTVLGLASTIGLSYLSLIKLNGQLATGY